MLNLERLLRNWDYEDTLSTHKENEELIRLGHDKSDILELLSYHTYDDISELVSHLNGDCNHIYISDDISERADSDVNVYNWNLRAWLVDNYGFFEDAVSEFGIDSNNFDFHRTIMTAQYLMFSNGYYSAIENLKEFLAENFKY